jgi:hypothetical protein
MPFFAESWIDLLLYKSLLNLFLRPLGWWAILWAHHCMLSHVSNPTPVEPRARRCGCPAFGASP